MSTIENRIAKGKAKMVELFGPGADESTGLMFEMAPDFGNLVHEIIFGEIWSNPALDTKLRSFITMASLIALDRQPELRLHFRAALNLGITKEQIIALISHVGFYGGVPVSLNSLRTAKEVFEKWDVAQKKKRS